MRGNWWTNEPAMQMQVMQLILGHVPTNWIVQQQHGITREGGREYWRYKRTNIECSTVQRRVNRAKNKQKNRNLLLLMWIYFVNGFTSIAGASSLLFGAHIFKSHTSEEKSNQDGEKNHIVGVVVFFSSFNFCCHSWHLANRSGIQFDFNSN